MLGRRGRGGCNSRKLRYSDLRRTSKHHLSILRSWHYQARASTHMHLLTSGIEILKHPREQYALPSQARDLRKYGGIQALHFIRLYT